MGKKIVMNYSKDAGRKMARIDYDPRNNPVRIQFTDGNVTKYVYSATGEKLRVVYQTAVPNVSVAIGSARELSPSEILSADSVDYLLGGSLTLRNGRIDRFQFDEGYCQAKRYTYNHSQDDFIFYYYDRDHLGNIRQVVKGSVSNTGNVVQGMDYYPFGAQFCDGSTDNNFQSRRYNGKEFDGMHGLNTYDYGARQYNPVTARWDRVDPLSEKYYSISPYAYCANNPINAIDEEGRLIIFINGFNFGDGGKSAYWGGFDNAIRQHYKEHRASLYYDGSIGGPLGLFPTIIGNQISLNFHTEKRRPSSYYAETRYIMGYESGELAVDAVFSSLSRDGDGKINEPIRIVSHSMGGAFAKGYAQALMDYIIEHPNSTNGASLVEYDFAPFQPKDQKAVNGVDTYQYSHHFDKIAHDERIEGAHYNTSYDVSKGHSISDFFSYINQLPEGQYVVINGQIVRKNEKRD